MLRQWKPINRLAGWYGMYVPTVETVGCDDGGRGSGMKQLVGDGEPGCPGTLAHGFNRGMMKTDKSVRWLAGHVCFS